MNCTHEAIWVLGHEFAQEIIDCNKKSREEQAVDDVTDLMIKLGVFDDDFEDEDGADFQATLETAGNAAYVYRSIRVAARHIIDVDAVVSDYDDIAPDDLTNHKFGCRVFLHCALQRHLPGAYIEDYYRRRGLPVAHTARELFLSVQQGKTSKGSSGLRRQRENGCSGQAAAAVWLAVRDNIDLNPAHLTTIVLK